MQQMVALMSNEHLGIFEELRARAQRFEQRAEERKRMLQMATPVAHTHVFVVPLNRRCRQMAARRGYHHHHPDDPRRRKIHSESQLGITLTQVLQAVCSESEIMLIQLLGMRRSRALAGPRHVAWWMIDHYCPEYSLHEIAYVFCGRDHTTIIHGINQVDRRLHRRDLETRALVACVQHRLRTQQ